MPQTTIERPMSTGREPARADALEGEATEGTAARPRQGTIAAVAAIASGGQSSQDHAGCDDGESGVGDDFNWEMVAEATRLLRFVEKNCSPSHCIYPLFAAFDGAIGTDNFWEGGPLAEAEPAVRAFYSLQEAERTRILNGWKAEAMPLAEGRNYRDMATAGAADDALDSLLVVCVDAGEIIAHRASLPHDSTSAVTLMIRAGSTRQEVADALRTIIAGLGDHWEKIVALENVQDAASDGGSSLVLTA